MEEWPISVQKVIERYPDARIVVPGHGEVGEESLLTHTVEILNNWNKEHP